MPRFFFSTVSLVAYIFNVSFSVFLIPLGLMDILTLHADTPHLFIFFVTEIVFRERFELSAAPTFFI